jgi:hypothetical protein
MTDSRNIAFPWDVARVLVGAVRRLRLRLFARLRGHRQFAQVDGFEDGCQLSLIPELEEVVQHGSSEKRVETFRRITALFLDGASRYNDARVDLFDDVFGLLIDENRDQGARVEFSNHLRPSATRRSSCCAS